jgi:adenosine deaminase
MPKVELHTHIEGAVRPHTLIELAKANGIDLPTDEAQLQDLISMKPGENLLDLLKKFEPYRFVFDSAKMIETATYDALRQELEETELYSAQASFLKPEEKQHLLNIVRRGIARVNQDVAKKCDLAKS